MKIEFKKVTMILAVVMFVFCGSCLVNANSSAQSWLGEIAKGGSHSFSKLYSYPLHQGAAKPTKYGTSMTWTLQKHNGSKYVTKYTQVLSSMSLNKTYWTNGQNIGSGNAKHIFTANNKFYGNIQTLNATV